MEPLVLSCEPVSTHAPPLPKFHRVELALAARIREGFYDNTGLPGERELAQEFQVARVTVRSALRRLQDQGVVVRLERQGTLVAAGKGGKPMPKMVREYVDAFLDRGRKDRRKVLRFGFVAASREVAQALWIRPGEEVLRVVRLRSDAASTLTYTEVYVPRHIAPAVTRAALERKAFVQLLEDSGVKIGMAEQGAQAEGAPLAVSDALGVPLHAPILKLTRVLRDPAGSPLQLLLGWFRADRFEVRMQMSRAKDATKVWIGYRE
jgi:GntR family transcriptional regulator